MPPLLADFTHARPCKPFCEKYLTLPHDELNDELWSKSTQKPLVLIFSKTEKVPIYGTFPSVLF